MIYQGVLLYKSKVHPISKYFIPTCFEIILLIIAKQRVIHCFILEVWKVIKK